MFAIIRYIFLTASRDWLFIGLLASTLLASFISYFLGSTALSEQAAMQLTYIAGSSRMILTVGMILFICFHIRKSFDNREVEYTLSHSISRAHFVIAYFIAFSLLAVIVTLPPLFIIALFFKPPFIALAIWLASVILELILISSFAILASLILRSAVSATLACFAFYLVSRMMGFAVANITLPHSLEAFKSFNAVSELLLKTFSILMPRLDLFAKSNWLTYGAVDSSALYIVLTQSAIYVPIILLMSIYDFQRKQF
jgi:ABC-type transport system involved in multi-copper enzyme maturation permease subunit